MAQEKAEFPYDFFVSRREAAADIAVEVVEVLENAGYRVVVQDFDFRIGGNFVVQIHNALAQARHFIGLLTEDYASSPFTEAEWTNFYALAVPSGGIRRLIVLRVDNVDPPGLLAAIVYGDLHDVTRQSRRKEIILAAAEGRSTGIRRESMVFRGVPPLNPDFIGRDDLLKTLQHELGPSEQSVPVAIHGLPGIGKSSLAAKYVHQSATGYAGVWWMPAESRAILMASLYNFAVHLDRTLESETNLDKVVDVGLGRLSDGARPWLLIYDNVVRLRTSAV